MTVGVRWPTAARRWSDVLAVGSFQSQGKSGFLQSSAKLVEGNISFSPLKRCISTCVTYRHRWYDCHHWSETWFAASVLKTGIEKALPTFSSSITWWVIIDFILLLRVEHMRHQSLQWTWKSSTFCKSVLGPLLTQRYWYGKPLQTFYYKRMKE